MSDDRTTQLFFELMTGLPRQGPGDDASTARALSLVPNVRDTTRLLDIGCGTGAQTRALLRQAALRVVAIDSYPPFVDELNRTAQEAGLAERLHATVADMHALDFPSQSFDIVWCEGAIYNIGFETGLREWRRLLVPGGYLVVTEVVWTTSDVPDECREFWQREYPAIRSVPALLDAIDNCGYECQAHFPMPRAAWWENYYRPLQDNVERFRGRHAADADAQAVADSVQKEIDIWQRYGASYAYEFFVMRVREAA